MSSKFPTGHSSEEEAKQRSKPPVPDVSVTHQAQGSVSRPTGLQTGSAGLRNLWRLHHTIGNRAVSRLLTEMADREGCHLSQKCDASDTASTGEADVSSVNAVSVGSRTDETNLPRDIKRGIEELSGLSLDNVRVHYGSARPAQLDALAFTQGTDIHLAPGEEEHLAHEAWHVVQQMQGRVGPTRQIGGVSVNDDEKLEREADERGREALSLGRAQSVGHRRQGLRAAGVTSIPQRVAQLNGAPTITSETTFSAPDGTAKTRTDVGIGEEVTFTGSASGKWTADSGKPTTLAAGNKFTWTAPDRANAALNIKLEVAGKAATIKMKVVEPDSITGVKDSEIAIPAGTAGAGMKLTFNYHPKNVSFGNCRAREVSGPASNIKGYFLKHYTADQLKHDSGDTFTDIKEDNTDSVQDTAKSTDTFKPYEDGTFDWVIPNKFKVKTEAGDGKEFPNKVTQAFSIDATGKEKITKAGASVERSP